MLEGKTWREVCGLKVQRGSLHAGAFIEVRYLYGTPDRRLVTACLPFCSRRCFRGGLLYGLDCAWPQMAIGIVYRKTWKHLKKSNEPERIESSADLRFYAAVLECRCARRRFSNGINGCSRICLNSRPVIFFALEARVPEKPANIIPRPPPPPPGAIPQKQYRSNSQTHQITIFIQFFSQMYPIIPIRQLKTFP